ncbi:MAG: hypothetical protein IJB90_03265 [Clostridia bacterium]|nr:hypothetical protein [Clostridia bacterium]
MSGRILFIFSTKALIYTVVGGGLGYLIYLIVSMFKASLFLGAGITGIFGIIGFVIGTFKIPESANFEITKKTGGENIDEVILRAIKFKKKKNRIYLYTKEESK